MLEAMDSERYYRHSSAVFYKKHGHGVNMEMAKTNEEKNIVYAWYRREAGWEAVSSIRDILGFGEVENSRLNAVARAVRKWYESTGYKQLLPELLQKRILVFIEATGC